MNNMDDYIVPEGTWKWLQEREVYLRSRPVGFSGYTLHTGADVSKTLTARYYKDGKEILIDRGVDKRPRKLTGIECERLQSFPDNWTEGLSKTQRYICLGNALTPSVVTEILNRLYEE